MIKSGKVVQRELYVVVDGDKHYVPKECDSLMGPVLEKLAGLEVEVLIAQNNVVAIRPKKPELVAERFRVIVCYMCPPELMFDPDIIHEIEPIVTAHLVRSGYIDNKTMDALKEWKAEVRQPEAPAH